ncbi:MAG: hypothetical protein HRT61_00940 [Ekhidna sp.]|nr:hypothetical protein [Ekhidna sp.]
MKFDRDQLASLIINLNNNFVGHVPEIVREIDAKIQWSWDNWDEDLISNYYELEKPKNPTERFIYEWIAKEPFEHGSYDIEYLSRLF